MGVPQIRGYPARRHHERETLHERGLSHARVTQDEGVVLASATEHLHDVTNVGLTPDDGVQLALYGAFGEVNSILVQILRRGVVGCQLVLLEKRNGGKRVLVHNLAQTLHVHAKLHENLVGLAIGHVHDANEQVLRGNDPRMDFVRVRLCAAEHVHGTRCEVESEVAALVPAVAFGYQMAQDNHDVGVPDGK